MPNLDPQTEDHAALERAHARLAAAMTDRSWDRDSEDPEQPETVQAMQMVINLPKSNPPARTAVLEAAAQAVVMACLDERAGGDGAYAQALAQWYGHRIRKVVRRARNKAWDDVQALPGVTAAELVRAFAPSSVADVPPQLRKLQVGGTDIPADEPGEPRPELPLLLVDASLEMTLGKAAAQVGHGAMLLAGAMSWEDIERWRQQDFGVNVREWSPAAIAAELERPHSAAPIIVRDAGFTEVAPDSRTVVAFAPRT